MKKYTIKDSKGNKRIVYAKSIVEVVKSLDSNIRDIDTSSLMTLFTKYGKPYGYVCKTRPKMNSSGNKYLGQLVAYTLSPVGKYDMDKAKDFVDFLNRKGYEASIFAPNIIVTLKQDRSSGLYKHGHERVSQYDSIKNNNIQDDDDKVKYKLEVYSTGKPLWDIDKANSQYEFYKSLTEEEYITFIKTTPEAASESVIEDIRKDVNDTGLAIELIARETPGVGFSQYKYKVISNDPKHYKVMFYGMSLRTARRMWYQFKYYRPWTAKYWFNKPNISDITPYTGRIRK